ncbi:unnamed protein product [Peniophora sp. CBMAI 1063]|nr:unnamed protein product [Peniophora sp. CBMAI 1063]
MDNAPALVPLRPLESTSINSRTTLSALGAGTFKIFTDPSSATFTKLTTDVLQDLALALPHAQLLEEVSYGITTLSGQDLALLLNSTLHIANKALNLSATLKKIINQTCSLAYILRLPQEVFEEIFLILAWIAPPDVRRWHDHNLGWMALRQTCSGIRDAMSQASRFWAAVCTQLPRAHPALRSLARNVPLTFEVSTWLPAIPSAFSIGTELDRRLMATLLKDNPAEDYRTISSTDMRICASHMMKWIHAGSCSTYGLRLLEFLEVEGPTEFDDKADHAAVATFCADPFANVPLYTPALRSVTFTNLCYPLDAPVLSEFTCTYDYCDPPSDVTRPTISDIVSMLSRSSATLSQVILVDAIEENDPHPTASVVELPNLKYLQLGHTNFGAMDEILTRILVTPSCTVHADVKLEPHVSSVTSQIQNIFHKLLWGQPHDEHRYLRVRNVAIRNTYSRIEFTWAHDLPNARHICRFDPYCKTVTLQTPRTVSWLLCFRIFVNTLRALHYPPIKTLVLPDSTEAWEIGSRDTMMREVANALYLLRPVAFAWPLTRIGYVLGSTATLRDPNPNDPFQQYVEHMRRVDQFDMYRLECK